jgi:DNA-binding NtrC family response regulator
MSASGVNRTILHVDDDPQIHADWMQRRPAADKGYEVVVAQRPEYRRSARSCGRATGSCCWTSTCRDIDGLELLRRIKEYDGGIQVVMLTGLVTLGNAMAAFRGGADACFFKPVEDRRCA